MHNANVTAKASSIDVTPIVWNQIDWKQVNMQVNNLRRRIYRASAEGDKKKAGNLQKLMIKSKANKLLAIRRVTQVNRGRRTPGIDKVVVNTDVQRSWLFNELFTRHHPRSAPIKRVYIPKKNGKHRPLGLPTILDRCRQAVVKSALEPYWEAQFERVSYGFRPGRGAHDAMQKIFSFACSRAIRPWILDADIKGAFDNIDHDYLMKAVGNFPARLWIQAWLKSGVIENNEHTATSSGTPQGGVISPLLANIALHGMEQALNITYDKKYGTLVPKSEYALVRYADDFVIFAKTKQFCERAKLRLTPWLARRGLELSEEKTRICHIFDGFDFLGFNVRRYKTKAKRRGEVLLTKPSSDSIKSFKQRMIREWKKSLGWSTNRVIENLNPKIIGWCNYFRVGTSKAIFSKLDDWMYLRQKRFVERRHPNKYWWWRKPTYWGMVKGRRDHWVFMDKVDKNKPYLWKLAWTPIKRHILVKGTASPDDPDLQAYWQNRRAKNKNFLNKQRNSLWRKQYGVCPLCLEPVQNLF